MIHDTIPRRHLRALRLCQPQFYNDKNNTLYTVRCGCRGPHRDRGALFLGARVVRRDWLLPLLPAARSHSHLVCWSAP